MPTLIFVLPDHTEIAVRARAGNSLMRVAVDADIPGIPGECGGALACATCHVWIDRRWADGLPVPEGDIAFDTPALPSRFPVPLSVE